MVLNALDNRVARNHVNRMCLAANIPLIETGTAGYAGQVHTIQNHIITLFSKLRKQQADGIKGIVGKQHGGAMMLANKGIYSTIAKT